MNASEIKFLESRLPMGVVTLPSPESMVDYHAKVRSQRNAVIASLFLGLFVRAAKAVREMRRIAEACSAARLNQHAV